MRVWNLFFNSLPHNRVLGVIIRIGVWYQLPVKRIHLGSGGVYGLLVTPSASISICQESAARLT